MLQSVAFSSGTGKSHFVEALAHAAIDKDLRVAWFTLESLTTTITRAKIDGSVARTVTRICRCDLIVVDDIGMLPAGQDAAEAFYRRRCRLRAPLRSSDQQHPSVRIRLDHAQNPGHGNSGQPEYARVPVVRAWPRSRISSGQPPQGQFLRSSRDSVSASGIS